MKTITITHLDQMSDKTNLKTNALGFILIASFILIVAIVGIFLLADTEEKIRIETSDKLSLIVNTTAEAFDQWLENRMLDISIKSRDGLIVKLVEDIAAVPRNSKSLKNSNELKLLREYFKPFLERYHDLGFFIITPDSISVASMKDINTGEVNFLFQQRGEFLDRVFKGESIIVPPVESDVALPETSGKVAQGFSTMFIASPIINSKDEVIAAMAIRINLAKNFSDITTIGRFGTTGETIALDDMGKLLSRSRFENLFRERGLLAQASVSRTTFEIRNPGVDLTRGLMPTIPRFSQPFTKMSESIHNKKSGFDYNGYQGYKGTSVLGAWKWIDHLGFGLATEIDEDEALQLYHSIKLLTLIGLCVIVVFAIALVLGMLWVRRKSFQALQEINEKLAQNIAESTKELANSNLVLVDSWERFRKLTHHSHDLNKIISSNGVIKFESSAVERMLGTREGDRIGKSFFDFIHPEDVDRVERIVKKLSEDPLSIGSAEFRYKRNDNSWVVLESFMQNFEDDPNIEGLIINSRDVTDRRLAEENVKKSEQRFRSVWENSRDGMRITDSDGMILMVNNMFSNMVKMETDKLIGESFAKIYRENLQDTIQSQYFKNFDNGDIIGRHEEELKLWDDSVLWFSISNSYIQLDDGSRVLLSIMRDITESKKTELIRQIIYKINNTVFEAVDYNDLLKRVHEVFNEFIKTDNFFIATYNKGSKTISIPYMVDQSEAVNDIPIEKTFTGYVIKKGKPVLLHEKDSLKMIEDGEVELIGKLAKVWVGIPIMVREELSGVMVIQDYENEDAIGENQMEILKFVSDQVGLVMDRILARGELEKSEINLREVNQTKDKFFSILAHDLRNPFVTILGFSDILHEDYKDMNDEERLNLIHEMRTTAQNTYGLLENLLNWSRSETGNLKINPRLFKMKEMVENIFGVVDGNARMKEIDLGLEVDADIKVFADKSTVETALRNLITNAIKFTPIGGWVKVTAIDMGQHIEVAVQDNGIGIKDDVKDKLFNLKENTSTRGTANEAGSGLGLVLCKEFIEKNNGKVWIEREADNLLEDTIKGTTFKFTLPKM
ncbi:MAG: PAS domain S-box protein [Bacteroidetes bacterium]|nr:PAS domain S-box protein [Bacteroidota bacterium]